jgi:hypothetical protein
MHEVRKPTASHLFYIEIIVLNVKLISSGQVIRHFAVPVENVGFTVFDVPPNNISTCLYTSHR